MRLFINKILFGGKNGQQPYWVRSIFMYLLPLPCRAARLAKKLQEARTRADHDYIEERARHYCKLTRPSVLPPEAHPIGTYTYSKRVRTRQRYFMDEHLAKSYFFDSYEMLRWFPRTLRWMHHFGDVTEVPPFPCIVKTRPIDGENSNSVILNLDKNRHFTFVRDTTAFADKRDMLICRCDINNQPYRTLLFQLYHGKPWADIGEVTRRQTNYPPEWKGNKISIYDHLQYRYIACFEGNDVASNLKWVMSSNSIAVMNRPTYESWFMESRLIPNYHYILVKDDLSDLKERLDYYSSHLDEAQAIIDHAHEYVAQFQNHQREELIALRTLELYFEYTAQNLKQAEGR